MATEAKKRKISQEQDKIIRLNVGGKLFTTSLKTLKKEKDSKLDKMFTQEGKGLPPTIKVDEGNYFIDRDGTLFQYILNFLRCDTELHLPKNFGDMERLKSEVDFYGLTEMAKALKDYPLTPNGRETMWISIAGYQNYTKQNDGVDFKEPVKLFIYCTYETFYGFPFPDEVKHIFISGLTRSSRSYLKGDPKFKDMGSIVKNTSAVKIEVTENNALLFLDIITKGGFSYKGSTADDIMIYERELV